MRLIRSVVIALAVTACSSTVSSFGGGFGGESAAPNVALDAAVPRSDVPTVSACPDIEPSDGDPCTSAATACEYGTAALPACDDVFDCVATNDGRWTLRTDASTICSATCPSDFTAIEPGGACAELGALCTYYEATCGCMGSEDAGDPDAGAGTWSCTRPALGCPARRPRLGESCVHEMTCDYGSCLFGASLAFACTRLDSETVAWTATAPKACP